MKSTIHAVPVFGRRKHNSPRSGHLPPPPTAVREMLRAGAGAWRAWCLPVVRAGGYGRAVAQFWRSPTTRHRSGLQWASGRWCMARRHVSPARGLLCSAASHRKAVCGIGRLRERAAIAESTQSVGQSHSVRCVRRVDCVARIWKWTAGLGLLNLTGVGPCPIYSWHLSGMSLFSAEQISNPRRRGRGKRSHKRQGTASVSTA